MAIQFVIAIWRWNYKTRLEPARAKEKIMRKWKCPDCGREIEISYDEFADIGIPICGNCERDMELQPED